VGLTKRVKIIVDRGLEANLPFGFEPGRLYVCEDTRKIFAGQGVSLPLVLVGTGQTGLNFRGAWSGLPTYNTNDLVTFNNALYICLNLNSNERPDLFPADWEVIVSVPNTTTISLMAGENINAFQAVAVHADGLAYKADASNAADAGRVVGIAITSATTGNSLEVQQLGEIDNAGFLFTPGAWVYLGTGGALVQTPNAGAFELPLGVALSASRLEAQVGLPIIRA
jgi:hypothetical protein